jgi:hypothetical protein
LHEAENYISLLQAARMSKGKFRRGMKCGSGWYFNNAQVVQINIADTKKRRKGH